LAIIAIVAILLIFLIVYMTTYLGQYIYNYSLDSATAATEAENGEPPVSPGCDRELSNSLTVMDDEKH
jgi:hypothetical protein